MKRYLLIGTCAAVLGGGVALAQVPPTPPPGSDGQGGPGPNRMMMMRRMHHGWEQGTSFRFRKGDALVDIHCSVQEGVQACVSGATTLLDKLNAVSADKPAQ